MAIENQISPAVNDNKSYLSKVKVGDTTYHLKDAEAREVLSEFEYTDTASGSTSYTPAGTISKPTITITPTTTSVRSVTSVGSAISITEGSVSQATSSQSQFPIEGMIATYNSEDEGLVLTVSSKTPAITAVGAVSYTPPVLSGSIPTFGDSTSVVSSVSAELATAPVFTGTAATISISVTPDMIEG